MIWQRVPALVPLPVVCFSLAEWEILTAAVSMSKVIRDCFILISWLRYNNSWNRATSGIIMDLDTNRPLFYCEIIT